MEFIYCWKPTQTKSSRSTQKKDVGQIKAWDVSQARAGGKIRKATIRQGAKGVQRCNVLGEEVYE